jgi:hypothetical protein
MPDPTTSPRPGLRRRTGPLPRDPAADLARWPVAHLLDCPALDDDELAQEMVEFYRTVRITTKKPPQDVTDDQRPNVPIMVAHCVLCGGISYHDIVTQYATVGTNGHDR